MKTVWRRHLLDLQSFGIQACCRVGLIAAASLLWAIPAQIGLSQDGSGNTPPAAAPGGVLDGLDQLPGLAPGLGSEPVTLTAEYALDKSGKRGVVRVQALLAPGWHLYSTTQLPGGPLITEIGLAPSSQKLVRLTGGFVPDRPPHVEQTEDYDVPVESYTELVEWTAPFEVIQPFSAEKTTLAIEFAGQVCKEACQPVSETLQASYAGEWRPPSGPHTVTLSDGHISWTGKLSRGRDGTNWELQLTASPQPPWHVYALWRPDRDAPGTPVMVRLVLPDGWELVSVEPSAPPEKKPSGIREQPFQYQYERPVTWSFRLRAPAGADGRAAVLHGFLAFQVCKDDRCDKPEIAEFHASADREQSRFVWLEKPQSWSYRSLGAWLRSSGRRPFERHNTNESSDSGNASSGDSPGGSFSLTDIKPQDNTRKRSFMAIVALAALGGFLLNFMPCVLPVIGLKVMAFVQQAGADRRRVFLLNLFYSAGLISVFVVLATLLVVFDLGWGQQSQYLSYQVAVASIIFVMGLSFLGVWEIPLPGFVGTSKLAKYSERREGYSAAFAKGIFTTLVAIPCTAPALATALAWCADKPAHIVYPVFLTMGLGMAFPYLLIGVQPKLVSFLPKPGMWMETFKEFLGFLLLATVVWFLWQMEFQYVVPTVAFLFGLWMACWIVGKIPITATRGLKWSLRAASLGIAVGVGWFAFGWFEPIVEKKLDRTVAVRSGAPAASTPRNVSAGGSSESAGVELPWLPFSLQRLEDETAKGNTVMVDFTADW